MLCPANMLGAMSAIRLKIQGVVIRHPERSVPRLLLCAKRRDTQSKDLSSL